MLYSTFNKCIKVKKKASDIRKFKIMPKIKRSRQNTSANNCNIDLVNDNQSPYFGKKNKKSDFSHTEKEMKIIEQHRLRISDDIEDTAQNLVWKPTNWEKNLECIREMRKARDAPVDTMGCDKCMDMTSSPAVIRFQSLVSLMLSSQTKDTVTYAAMERLKNHENGLTIASLLEMSDEALGKLIYPVGFWKTKVKYLKKTCQILKDKYNNDVPKNVDELCLLPGVGPKMAHLCMKSAWGIISGIGVDTHVHRISNRIGWVRKTTKTPEQTRKELESWLPKNLWEEVNHLLVGFGQQICKPVNPLCESCLNRSYCPYNKKKGKVKMK